MKRVRILLALSAVVTVASLGTATGAAGFKFGTVESDWTGTTSTSQGYRVLNFEAQALRKKGARRAVVYRMKRWLFGIPLTCTGLTPEGSDTPEGGGYQQFPGYASSGGDPSLVGVSGRGPKMAVRNGRFSAHGVYNVLGGHVQTPKRITYDVTGRFSGSNATGTLEVNTLWSHPDGTKTSCASGPQTWSACAWNQASFNAPPCAGIDPTE